MVNTDLLIAGVVLVAATVLLLAHHAYKHRPGGPEHLEYPDRCFQCSDVGNFHSCSHEMWALAMLFAAAVLILVSVSAGLHGNG